MSERLAELMHLKWLAVMAEQGRHPPELCPHAREYPCSCPKCHDGMYEWADLPEKVKDVNRRGVLRFFRELGITLEQAKVGVNVGKAVLDAQSVMLLLQNVQPYADKQASTGEEADLIACAVRTAILGARDILLALGEVDGA